jgi:DNA-directed RNA polymerase subunit K
MEYTKYEKARVIGARSLQLSMGAPFMLKLSEKDLERVSYNTLEIAKMEFEQGLIPITVKRPLPQKREAKS